MKRASLNTLIHKIKQLGCGTPLGFSGAIHVYCKFPAQTLCNRCKKRYEQLCQTSPNALLAAILELSEELDAMKATEAEKANAT